MEQIIVQCMMRQSIRVSSFCIVFEALFLFLQIALLPGLVKFLQEQHGLY